MRTVKEIKETINQEVKAAGYTMNNIHYVQAAAIDGCDGGCVHIKVSIPMDSIYIDVAEEFLPKLAHATRTKLVKIFGSDKVKVTEIDADI